ncbi:hypothetical protein MAHJHV57_51890 [Mycobacterium avium subsp. hominissuis]
MAARLPDLARYPGDDDVHWAQVAQQRERLGGPGQRQHLVAAAPVPFGGGALPR